MTDAILQRIKALAPEQFENLIFECLRARGMKNVIWRTPGADGGRDIEGVMLEADISGATDVRRWYVECKRYSTTLDWPTVRGKVAYAESNDADFLLVATTANPTPQCENEISKWNAGNHRPQVRFWRGYDLPNIIRGVPHIAAIFGLGDNRTQADAALIPLAEVVMGLAQASYAQSYFSGDKSSSSETVAAISELFGVRLRDLRDFGRAVVGPGARGCKLFLWLHVNANLDGWEDTSLRAVLSFLRYEHQADTGILTNDGEDLILSLAGVRPEYKDGLNADREIVSFWARISASCLTENTWVLRRLPYVD